MVNIALQVAAKAGAGGYNPDRLACDGGHRRRKVVGSRYILHRQSEGEGRVADSSATMHQPAVIKAEYPNNKGRDIPGDVNEALPSPEVFRDLDPFALD